jgi:hypothetical protein
MLICAKQSVGRRANDCNARTPLRDFAPSYSSHSLLNLVQRVDLIAAKAPMTRNSPVLVGADTTFGRPANGCNVSRRMVRVRESDERVETLDWISRNRLSAPTAITTAILTASSANSGDLGESIRLIRKISAL